MSDKTIKWNKNCRVNCRTTNTLRTHTPPSHPAHTTQPKERKPRIKRKKILFDDSKKDRARKILYYILMCYTFVLAHALALAGHTQIHVMAFCASSSFAYSSNAWMATTTLASHACTVYTPNTFSGERMQTASTKDGIKYSHSRISITSPTELPNEQNKYSCELLFDAHSCTPTLA